MRNKGLGKLKTLRLRALFRVGNGKTKGINQQAGRRLAAPRPSPASAQTAPGTTGEELSLCPAVPWHTPGAAADPTPIVLSLGHILIILWDDAQGESARSDGVGAPTTTPARNGTHD